MNNYLERDAIIERAMIAFNCNTEKQLADLFKISAQDLSNRKKTGTYIKLIEKEAYRRHLSYDWIKSGQGSMKVEHGTIGEISPPHSASPSDTIPVRISDLLSKTAAILESQTTYSTALKSNIVAFHHAMTCEEQLDLANKRIDTLEDHVKAIESRLLKVNESS